MFRGKFTNNGTLLWKIISYVSPFEGVPMTSIEPKLKWPKRS